MRIKIETFLHFEYAKIEKLYGHILKEFNLTESNNRAYIELKDFDDMKKLDKMLSDYISSNECKHPDIYSYYGLLFSKEDSEYKITIQDNYS